MADNKTVIQALQSLAEADTRLKQVYLAVMAYTVPGLLVLVALLVGFVLLGMVLRVASWALGFGDF